MSFSEIYNDSCNFVSDKAFSGELIDITEPATRSRLGSFAAVTINELDGLIETTKAAQEGWANTDFDARAKVIRRFAALLEENASLINTWNTRECGSIEGKAQWELQACIDQAYMCAALPMTPYGDIYPSNIPGRENHCIRVPVGLVGVISPWNFPLLLSLRAVLPALAMGNSVIVKPDINSAVVGGYLIVELLKQAGLPEGICTLAPGGVTVGQRLVEHPQVDMIAFTGSTAAGRQIGQVCGGMFKKVALELGGNNAFVVLDDANIEGASSCAAWGSFLHQGQICMQAGRHIVHESVADAYVEALCARAENLAVGNPYKEQVHLGPVINARQADRVMGLIADSVAMGARVVCGGKREGAFIYPTVITQVTPDMPIFKEEIFGPVAPVVTFTTDDEAVALANNTQYGLAASIQGADISRAKRIANRIDAGMVHINDQTVNNEYQVPFGGMKSSGNSGRFGGPANLEEFTERKWISIRDEALIYPF
ncbi:aldehyde dehydrogenase family protein [uncultured Amphritea sp.]|uniref:aldehyde dehydrogenase family protein n=1 Tax=uncultured Amphritea sp. TaxID=981605 RepID=UPI0026017D5C|nr:aldehyde dehydrogenase family protein [uncultured Amphritea sp.]